MLPQLGTEAGSGLRLERATFQATSHGQLRVASAPSACYRPGALFLLATLTLSLAGAAPERVVVPEVSVTDPSLRPLAVQTQERLATELQRLERFEVLTSGDVAQLLGLERQRQLLGCDEAAGSCLAELSNALGAPWLATGSLSGTAARVRFDFKFVSVATSRVVVREGGDVRPEELPALVTQVVRAVAASFSTSERAKAGEPSVAGPVVTIALGGAALAGGVVGLILLHAERDRFQANVSSMTAVAIASFNERFAAFRALWIGLTAAGALAAAGGALWLALTPKPVGRTAWWLSPAAGGVALNAQF